MPRAKSIEHRIAYGQTGRFAGWPANYGMWAWGQELLVLFSEGAFIDAPQTHKIDKSQPVRTLQARSLDDGRTWTAEPFCGPTPKCRDINVDEHSGRHKIGNPYEGENPPTSLRDPLDLTSSETAILVGRSTCASAPEPIFSWFHASDDRGRTWRGPYRFMGLDESLLLASRTDIVPLGPRRALFMITCHKSDGREGRIFCADTHDGGCTFRHLAWLAPQRNDGYEIMPSSVLLPDGSILTASRVGFGKNVQYGAILLYRSADQGRTWTAMPPAVPSTGRLSNPPSLLLLRDGRLCLVYGFRDAPSGIRGRLSADGGQTWSKEIILRDDGGDHDIGYTRAVLNSRGEVVTAYYYDTDPNRERFIGVSIWDTQQEV